MATYVGFQDFSEQLTRGNQNFGSDTYKIALTNTAPNAATNTALADITQIAASGGYSSGGSPTTITLTESGGTTYVSGTQVVFTSTGTLGPFRYAVLYNDTTATPVNKPLVAYWDYGSSITLNLNETFTVKFNNASPGYIFTLV